MKKIRLIKNTAILAVFLCSPFIRSAEATDGTMDAAQALYGLQKTASVTTKSVSPTIFLKAEEGTQNQATCPPCKRIFNFSAPTPEERALFKQTFINHMVRIEQAKEKGTLCPAENCCCVPATSYDLKEHVRSEHKEEMIYGCSGCTMRFFKRNSLHTHFKTHKKKKAELLLLCADCKTWHPHRERETHVCAPAASTLESERHTQKRARLDGETN